MSEIASQITSLTIVYSTVHLGADQSKHQSSASLAFVREIHRWPVNFPHKWPVTRKKIPFDDVIMVYLALLTVADIWLTFSSQYVTAKVWPLVNITQKCQSMTPICDLWGIHKCLFEQRMWLIFMFITCSTCSFPAAKPKDIQHIPYQEGLVFLCFLVVKSLQSSQIMYTTSQEMYTRLALNCVLLWLDMDRVYPYPSGLLN